MALAHLTMIWAPGGPKIMSPLKKWREGSKEEEEEGQCWRDEGKQSRQGGKLICK